MSFFPLLFTVFVDSLGFGLVFPLLSPLIMMEGGGLMPLGTPTSVRGLVLGLLISSFCLGQFFGGPILGALSDRKGRKKIICLTLWVGLLSYLLAGVSIYLSSVVLFLIARIACGISAGNMAVAQSMVADLSTESDRAKNFGLVGMAWGVGFILGPYIGGQLSDPDCFLSGGVETPFFAAAVLCGINLLLSWKMLKESLTTNRRAPLTLLGGVRDLKRAFMHPSLRGIFIVTFIFSLGWGFFTEFSALFLMDRFSFGPKEIGNFYAYAGIWVALCQGLLIRPFLKRFHPGSLLKGGCIALGLCLLTFLSSSSPQVLLLAVPLIALPEALIYPNAATLVSTLSSKEEQGEMLGIHNSVQWAAIGLIPLFSGSFVALYPHLPITVASICMFLAAGVFTWFFRKASFINKAL